MIRLNSRSTKLVPSKMLGWGLLLPLLAILTAGCTQRAVPVSYKETVVPLLTEHCGRCHEGDGPGTQKSGLAMDSYEQLLKGTRIGPVIKPGDATGSTLIALVEGRADPAIRMPIDGHNPLSADEIRLIRRWINEGAKNN
jgi:hypothetical protein